MEHVPYIGDNVLLEFSLHLSNHQFAIESISASQYQETRGASGEE